MRAKAPFVRLALRLVLAVAVAAGPIWFGVTGCGTDAVGVDICRQLEDFRCDNVEYACGTQQNFTVDGCERYYRDACLAGLENTDAGGTDTDAIKACTDSLTDVMNCAHAGGSLAACGIHLTSDLVIDGGTQSTNIYTPCDIFKSLPYLLPNCAFVVGGGSSGTDGGSLPALNDAGFAPF